MKILFVSPEIKPFVKTGGLGDVSFSLPKAIAETNHDIRLVMPEYSNIDNKHLSNLEHVVNFRTEEAPRDEYVGINYQEYKGLKIYFVDNKSLFDRNNYYDNDDRHEQFSFFCQAVLEMLPRIDFQPDIIHFNDWQTGPLALMLKDKYRQYDFYKDIRTVFTIHNLKYQGIFGRRVVKETLGIDTKYWFDGTIRHNNLVNFMKMGIMHADVVNTVSKTYAQEIKTSEFGEGLDYALRLRDEDFYGILNGIDYQEFNPLTDADIYVNYQRDSIEKKVKNKLKLQRQFSLKVTDKTPVIGMISRLNDQKGIELVLGILNELMKENIHLIILGTGNRYYENRLKKVSHNFKDRLKVEIKFDEKLARKIYAGSDYFLVPSKFEPCGLTQLISLRYGSIPIVRETGGLNDTITPYNELTDEGNGFSFTHYKTDDLLSTLKYALDYYKDEVFYKLQKRGLKADYSWKKSAEKYIKLYQKYV